MRKWLLMMLMVCGLGTVRAQSFEIQQLILNVEKLAQMKGILSDMKKGYDIVAGGYNTVKNLSQGNFDLHKAFLDGLMAVSPTVRKYHKVAEIISIQLTIISEYKKAAGTFRVSDLFNDNELSYIDRVYDNLFQQSLKNLDDLATIITDNQLRMSDDERLEAIDQIHDDIQDKLLFLRHFNSRTKVLAVQRAGQQQETKVLKQLHDVTE
ncbi:TerB family tellurite resistance protein [Filimonas effusa]|uniref:TerB family tellurite resistance protein n=1 Tax=Filimonas effusa TaxID=2508721 RepID=A0A4Q1DC13_9BACT|nr:TerB family tellurite resistance protein [Filimonas effusa]RXK86987.1 TerB family tellurite resistance protein [Filimonas effusa]